MLNRQKLLAQKKRWYERHKEEIKRKQRERIKKQRSDGESLLKLRQNKNRWNGKWRTKNQAYVLADARKRQHADRKSNPDKFRKRDRDRHARRKADPVKWRKWLTAQRNRCIKRRAMKYAAKGSHTRKQWLDRVVFYGWHCFYCRRPLNADTLTMDHRIPLSRGGSNFASNLVPACAFCNQSKGVRKRPATVSTSRKRSYDNWKITGATKLPR